ncbi:hypothetical protein DVH05_003230 [Phytophthora capsici]|nr:hypothetical protein DVH05_003230 [Phytophthora capsici]
MYGFLGKAWFPNFPAFAIGDIISWCYIFVYWKYSEDRRRVARYVALVAAALAVPTFYVTIGVLGFTGQQRVQVWETHGLCFCDFTVLFTSIFTVQNLLQSFKHKSAASINVRALIVGSSYSCGWITYGYLYSNWIIAGPQVWILTLHTVAWVMVIVFSRHSTTMNDTFQALSPV